MIPGPINFDPAVLRAMSRPTPSHTAPDFIEVFGEALKGLRKVFMAEDGQPFVVAGSGTLAMEMATVNFLARGDKVLVINTGYFGDRYADLLSRYPVEVRQVRAGIGEVPPTALIRETLEEDSYKVMTVTHVDTSTGVKVDVENIGRIARDFDTLTIVDGVCATAATEFRQGDWGIDVCFTASQKAIGVPPGLAILMVSKKALDRFQERTEPVLNFYCDLKNWLPVMHAYEMGRPSYFATPPVNLIIALRESVGRILEEGMENRFKRHRTMARAVQAAVKELGLTMVPKRQELLAETITAPHYPGGADPATFLGYMKDEGVIVAGGLHPEIKEKYFRIGHMGPINDGDILATVGAVEKAMRRFGLDVGPGKGLAAAQGILSSS